MRAKAATRDSSPNWTETPVRIAGVECGREIDFVSWYSGDNGFEFGGTRVAGCAGGVGDYDQGRGRISAGGVVDRAGAPPDQRGTV